MLRLHEKMFRYLQEKEWCIADQGGTGQYPARLRSLQVSFQVFDGSDKDR